MASRHGYDCLYLHWKVTWAAELGKFSFVQGVDTNNRSCVFQLEVANNTRARGRGYLARDTQNCSFFDCSVVTYWLFFLETPYFLGLLVYKIAEGVGLRTLEFCKAKSIQKIILEALTLFAMTSSTLLLGKTLCLSVLSYSYSSRLQYLKVI